MQPLLVIALALSVAACGSTNSGDKGTPDEDAQIIVDAWKVDEGDCEFLQLGQPEFEVEMRKNIAAKGHSAEVSKLAAIRLWTKIRRFCP